VPGGNEDSPSDLMAILERSVSPTSMPLAATPTHLRRCTYRRVTAIESRRALPLYEVACLFPDYRKPLPLGDLETARPICESCTAQGVFRPDSD
jgi:hypothetical protein